MKKQSSPLTHCSHSYSRHSDMINGNLYRVSYLIQAFVNKINTKLWNDWQVYLTDDLYYKVDHLNKVDWLNIFSWLIHRYIWKIKCVKTFKICTYKLNNWLNLS